jgi:hypothetical protein
LALVLLLGSCARGPLLERAIRARGGPLHGLVLCAEAKVHEVLPGTWQYTRTLLVPDFYAWTIETAAEPEYELFDGRTVRSFVGPQEVGTDTTPTAPLRSHARWTAVVNLDALRAPGVTLTALSAAQLPPGVREGVRATFADGAVYRLGFDERTLLVWAAGPLDLSPLGRGEATVRFADYRRTGGLLLAFAASYALDGVALADETVLTACVDPPGLTPASFTDPRLLPPCR